MSKTATLLLACATTLSLLVSQPAEAQGYGLRTQGNAQKHLIKQKVTPFQHVAKQNAFRKKSPLLCKTNNPLPKAMASPFANDELTGSLAYTITADGKVHVSAESAVTAPDSITNYTLTPDTKGAKSATISFTVPTKTISGATLSSVTKADIYRNDTVVKTLTSGLTPGSTVSYVDQVDTDAIYAYKVVLSNADGEGRMSSTKSAFIGTDVPAQVESKSILVKDNTNSITVSWKGITQGANGGYVDPAKVSYNIYDNLSYDDSYGYEYGNLLDSVCGVSQSTIAMTTNEGDQEFLNVYIQPQNTKGVGNYTAGMTILKGAPYEMPIIEPFDNGSVSTGLWWQNKNGSSSWNLNEYTESSHGGTPGVAVFDGCGDESFLSTGKIALAGAANPKLYFSVLGEVASKATLTVQIQKADGTVDSLETYEFNSSESVMPWQHENLSLAKYASEPYVIVRFLGNGTGLVALDNVQVRQVYAHDLAVSMSAPEEMKKGETGKVNVYVTNYGENTASAYTVRLLDGDEAVDSKTVSTALDPLASDTVTFDYASSVAYNGASTSLTAEVIYDADLDASNNTATATVNFIISSKPAPASASYVTGSAGTTVTWTAPDMQSKEVTETFEDYETWTIDNFGDWTTIDGDKGETGSILNRYEYGHQYEPFAFVIFEPNGIASDITENYPEMTPHSGDKYAASLYSILDDSFVDADNWLISPSLSGKKQTIKFYALNQGDSNTDYPETIELLYSTGGTGQDEFVSVKTVTIEGGNWQEVSFDVPEGATHFAIHHTTVEGGFMLAIDDVTYEAGDGVLTGYNVYRNGELIGTVDTSTLKYTDETSTSGTNVYSVTAVYTDGESEATAASDITGIDNVETADETKPFDAYTIDGKLVGKGLTSTRHLIPGIYVINGRKVTVKK